MTDIPRGSYCTRCRYPITDLAAYLASDFLCSKCTGESDGEKESRIVAAERQSTLREGNGR